MTDKALQKAFIVCQDTGEQLTCLFNPKEYTIKKSSQWKATPSKKAKTAPKTEFVGTNPRTLDMELFLEAWESASGDIATDVERLFTWANPTEDSLRKNKPQPPIVVFRWGSTSSFEAYVKSVSAKYTMFRPDGTPVRATVTVGLEETPMEAYKQNPTSGGVAGRRTHLVVAGDSLQSIAYREYGTPTMWRAIAVSNDIEDPLRVPPGSRLLIPPAADAAAMA
jgi:nucleoid-associated protein YgaU